MPAPKTLSSVLAGSLPASLRKQRPGCPERPAAAAFQGGKKLPGTVSFVNLICRFGDKFVLLDFANEIVLPAFTDSKLRRKYGDTTYVFQAVDLIEIPATEVA